MTRLGRHPVFSGILMACLATTFAEAWLVWSQWKLARSTYAQSEMLAAELRVLNDAIHPLDDATTAELTAELADAQNALAGLRAELTARGTVNPFEDSATHLERADGYFVLATFVEAMRESAKSCGVRVKPEEHFGFADYTHMGPEARDLPRVLRERHAMEFLLKAVFDARPRQLISVQRERRPAEGDAPAGSRSSDGSTARADYFNWDARESIRQPGLIDTLALRVSFVGQTVVLRTLLNRLAEFETPLVVRAVEVGPVAKAEERVDEGAHSQTRRPLVARTLSRFTVTVELLELVDAPETKSG